MRLAGLIVIALCLATGAQAQGVQFGPAVLHSVVTVLPLRTGEAPRRAPGDLRAIERSGSGVAIRDGGYIATNAHVLDRAASVSVRLFDGREVPAQIVGRDDPTDLAVLRIDETLPVLTPGPAPVLGEPVCAVGNPFGVGLTITCGVVSALHRTGMGFNPIEDFIQTDASINPGASGGALVNEKGRLVGLVTAIFTRRSDADIGINFATSLAMLNRVVDDLIAQGRVVRTAPGLQFTGLSREERRREVGVRVAGVVPGGAAARAGLKPGDVVTKIAGRTIRKRSDALAAIQLHRPGESFPLTYLRDGRPQTVTLTLPPAAK